MKVILISAASFLTCISCREDEVPSACIRGEVIGYEQCTNAVLVQVDEDHAIGDEITFYNKRSYRNVVRAPGVFGEYGDSAIYFQYREFAVEDTILFKPAMICLAVYAPFHVPTIVVTGFSTAGPPCGFEIAEH